MNVSSKGFDVLTSGTWQMVGHGYDVNEVYYLQDDGSVSKATGTFTQPLFWVVNDNELLVLDLHSWRYSQEFGDTMIYQDADFEIPVGKLNHSTKYLCENWGHTINIRIKDPSTYPVGMYAMFLAKQKTSIKIILDEGGTVSTLTQTQGGEVAVFFIKTATGYKFHVDGDSKKAAIITTPNFLFWGC